MLDGVKGRGIYSPGWWKIFGKLKPTGVFIVKSVKERH